MNTFLELAVILSAVCVIGFFALRLKLPLVVAYLLAGVGLSTVAVFDSSVLTALPEIGIAFVLFLIGMELNASELRSVGKPVIVATVVQVVFSTLLGFLVASAFGFSGSEALLIGVGLAFSSTIVIVKMLVERRDLASLYGKLSVGILLVEDLAAILMMTAVTTGVFEFGFDTEQFFAVLVFLAKAGALILLAYLTSRYVLDWIFDRVAKSIELLFLTGITWCFVFTSLAVWAGFSIVIGAFIAGVALATSPYQLQIQGKIKPLRDFFVALFFVYVGSQVKLGDIAEFWPVVLTFAALALFIKPIVYLTGLSFFGFRKHTLFQTALNMTQVSEFSLIVLLLGVQYGLASETALSLIAGAAVLSIMVSSVLISKSDNLYGALKPFVGLFQRKKEGEEVVRIEHSSAFKDHVVVIGADRVGKVIVNHLQKRNIPLVVLDYNPRVVHELRGRGIRTIYGDMSDPEIIEALELETARLIISTASGLVDNQTLLEACRRKKVKATVVVRAAEPEHEKIFKELGAHYVILPERVSGDFLVSKLQDEWPNLKFSNS